MDIMDEHLTQLRTWKQTRSCVVLLRRTRGKFMEDNDRRRAENNGLGRTDPTGEAGMHCRGGGLLYRGGMRLGQCGRARAARCGRKGGQGPRTGPQGPASASHASLWPGMNMAVYISLPRFPCPSIYHPSPSNVPFPTSTRSLHCLLIVFRILLISPDAVDANQQAPETGYHNCPQGRPHPPPVRAAFNRSPRPRMGTQRNLH